MRPPATAPRSPGPRSCLRRGTGGMATIRCGAGRTRGQGAPDMPRLADKKPRALIRAFAGAASLRAFQSPSRHRGTTCWCRAFCSRPRPCRACCLFPCLRMALVPLIYLARAARPRPPAGSPRAGRNRPACLPRGAGERGRMPAPRAFPRAERARRAGRGRARGGADVSGGAAGVAAGERGEGVRCPAPASVPRRRCAGPCSADRTASGGDDRMPLAYSAGRAAPGAAPAPPAPGRSCARPPGPCPRTPPARRARCSPARAARPLQNCYIASLFRTGGCN